MRDPTVISLELLTVFVAGPAAAAVAYAIVAQKPWRHPMQALLSLAELYGGAPRAASLAQSPDTTRQPTVARHRRLQSQWPRRRELDVPQVG